jgi:hypothetical protein
MQRPNMHFARVIEADEAVETIPQVSSHHGGGRADFFHAPDPSIYLLVDPPKRHGKFKSWFALAFFGGLLIALAIVAILNS